MLTRNLVSPLVLSCCLMTFIFHVVPSEAAPRESLKEMRLILANALCLGVGYDGSALKEDAEQVASTYIEALGRNISQKQVLAIRKMATEIRPNQPTPSNGRNYAIAKCTLFAISSDVQRLFQR